MRNMIITVYRNCVKFGRNYDDFHHYRQAIGWTYNHDEVPKIIEQYKLTHPEWEIDTTEFEGVEEEEDLT